MNNQEIIDNAPDGATHFNDDYVEYLRASKNGYMEQDTSNEEWDYQHSNHCRTRSLADIKRIVELEKELEKQLKPDLFWPENEGEIGFYDAHEAIGSMVDDYGAILGSMFTLDRAVKLSSQTYVLTEFDESTGSFEYEALKEPKL
jgi:hypothetical protein